MTSKVVTIKRWTILTIERWLYIDFIEVVKLFQEHIVSESLQDELRSSLVNRVTIEPAPVVSIGRFCSIILRR
jgi:hypothetical protein